MFCYYRLFKRYMLYCVPCCGPVNQADLIKLKFDENNEIVCYEDTVGSLPLKNFTLDSGAEL